MNLKANLLIFSLLLIPGLKLFAQDELNQPNLRFYLSEWTESKGQIILQTQIYFY
jgi:hypothetical protein